MRRKTIYIMLALSLLAALVIGSIGCSSEEGANTDLATKQDRLRVATTTSLYDTGLWSRLEPMFEDENDVELDVLYAGTGIAIEWGQRGDVDVITVHSKSSELKFIDDGYGVKRIPFAYNYFLVVGPEDDPAGIKGMTPEDAFKKLYETGDGKFVSRGDNSGTHSKEKAMWKAAGYADYDEILNAGDWYIEAGSGMGPTLLKANELEGYTLTDMGTYLAYKGDLDLVPIVDKGSILLNVYSVIVCAESDNIEMAEKLADFLTSDEIQDFIGEYGVEQYGMQLFTPCAGNEPTS